MTENIASLATEQVNRSTQDIDRLATLEMLALINAQDVLVSEAVGKELPGIARAVDAIYERMSAAGRLIYCGAGTSGRIGVLDAVECKPTFGVPDGVVVALLAGGDGTMARADEAAEDDAGLCAAELKRLDFGPRDVLVGISASGRTPYVAGGLAYARQIGGLTVALSCNPDSAIARLADHAISPVVGAEVISGSTRMKAGTVQKMVLNMISTCVMIKLGKVYKNLMVDMIASNSKLAERARHIVMEAAGCAEEEARAMLGQCGGRVKQAVIALLTGLSPKEAEALLARGGGRIASALESRP